MTLNLIDKDALLSQPFISIETIEEAPVIESRKESEWNKISPAGIYECVECGQNVMTDDIDSYKFCHNCGAKMVRRIKNERNIDRYIQRERQADKLCYRRT